MHRVREAVVAGLFYPGDARKLLNDVDALLAQSDSSPLPGTLKGLIVPHAGYMYSGATAAKGYSLLKEGEFPVVIIVGPSHREYFDGISIYPGDAYETPLGSIPIDEATRNDLVGANDAIRLSEVGHRAEHAIEVQLPFLQKVLGRFSFVPIVMGDQNGEYCHILSEALASVCHNRAVLLVASSDLSHYHPYDTALLLDRKVIRDVGDFNPGALLDQLERREVEACGGGPMVAVMTAAQKLGANSSRILFYCNSGDVTNQRDAVVGYLSAAFIQRN